MSDTFELQKRTDELERDTWRDTNPFSENLATAARAINHPFATDGDRQDALNAWMQRYQPCLFGRVAAAAKAIHYCFITDADIKRSDQHVQSKIRHSLILWRQRSLRPHASFSTPAHGFVLVVASERVAYARPDGNLRRFAECLRDLWGCPAEQTNHGLVNTESLYLERPSDSLTLRFIFSVDFFAAQGDGRWWEDHRVPGGIAFTANSAGHMRLYREWYQGKSSQIEWVLKTAMETIDYAADTPFGKATWLKPIINNRVVVDRLACPFADPSALKDKLKGKDWTRYGGHLHTDLSIRSEFFYERPEKSAEIQAQEYLQDFTYIFDTGSHDHVRFIAGQNVSSEEVVSAIGTLESASKIVGPRSLTDPEKRRELQQLLATCSSWQLTIDELAELDA